MKETIPSCVFFTWDIHYKCDYHCTYCFLHFEQDTANIKAVYLKLQDWFDIWQDIYARYGSCHIHVTGGEPFTYPGFIGLISELSKIHTFEFSTNFSFDIEKFAAKIRPDRVKVSPSFHPEFISADTFISKYLQLKDKGYLLGGVTVVGYPPLLEDLVKYRQVFYKAGIELIVYPYRGTYQNRTLPKEYNQRERELLALMGAEEKVSKELMDSYSAVGASNENLSLRQTQEKICGMGSRYAKISPNGEAFRCCAAVWNPAKTWSNWGGLGNIVDNTFALLDGPEPCAHSADCVCYKAMIVGEENKWQRHWRNVKRVLEYAEEEKVLNSAKAFRDQAKLDQATKELKSFLSKRNSAKVSTLLGEIYISKKDFISAERILQDALKENQEPGCLPWIYRCLGRLSSELVVNGAYDNNPSEREKMTALAITYLDKAITLAEENDSYQDKIWSIYEKARVYYMGGDYTLAKKNIDILLGYEPQNDHFKELFNKIEALK